MKLFMTQISMGDMQEMNLTTEISYNVRYSARSVLPSDSLILNQADKVIGWSGRTEKGVSLIEQTFEIKNPRNCQKFIMEYKSSMSKPCRKDERSQEQRFPPPNSGFAFCIVHYTKLSVGRSFLTQRLMMRDFQGSEFRKKYRHLLGYYTKPMNENFSKSKLDPLKNRNYLLNSYLYTRLVSSQLLDFCLRSYFHFGVVDLLSSIS